MALQFSEGVRNAMLDSIETTISTAPVLAIFVGAAPANCGTANSGTLLVSITLGSDWAAAASSGEKDWSDLPLSGTASGTGTAGHFRLFASGGTCHVQGTVGEGSGDLSLDNTDINSGQTVNITDWTWTAPGA